MKPVLTADEMRAADRATIESIGLPGPVLMESAGAAVAEALRARWPHARRLVVLCGKGNNGGDGFVLARRLLEREPEVYLLGRRDEVRADARLHLDVLERSGGRIQELPDEAAWQRLRERVLGAELIVDALLGTGLKQAPTGLVARVIGELAGLPPGRPPVVAVDIPSGVSSDSGRVEGVAVRADLTVTFAALKRGHVLPPACDRVGELIVADIGIPASALGSAGFGLLEAGDAACAFPPRTSGSHKGSYGHLLVVAGSVGKTGAAVLAGRAALLAGTGLVTVATPEPALASVAAGAVELMTEALPVEAMGGLDEAAVERALALASARDACALGPGLGQAKATQAFVRAFLERCPVPVAVDADGLNALAADPEGAALVRARSAPTVLTPHPGEMARLLGCGVPDVQADRLGAARSAAERFGSLVVLKGQRTLVVEPGARAAVNPTGNPGMASGGTGDVLSGLVGGLLARRLDAWIAATAAVYLHGRAGDLAAARVGQESLVAGDLVATLPDAIRSVLAGDA